MINSNIQEIKPGHPTLEEHKQQTLEALGETLVGVVDLVHSGAEIGHAVRDTVTHASEAFGSAAATGGHYVASKAHEAAHKAVHNLAEGVGQLIGSLVDTIDKLNAIADHQQEVVYAQLSVYFHNNPQARETLRAALASTQELEHTNWLVRTIGKAIGSVEAAVMQTGVLTVAEHISANITDGYQQGRQTAVQRLATTSWRGDNFDPHNVPIITITSEASETSEPDVVEGRCEVVHRLGVT